MTYDDLLNRQPPSTSAGNRRAAQGFVDLIEQFMGEHGTTHLSASQRNYLYKLRQRWERRAAGTDDEWNKYGPKPGRRKTVIPDHAKPKKGIDVTAYGEEHELDPLLATLIKKFGTPRKPRGL